MKKFEVAAIEAVAKRYSGIWSKKDSGDAYLEIEGRRIGIVVMTTKARARVPEPRLRFDRVAVGLVGRLQANLSKSVPDGRTVVVTVTAPIWQDSKTGVTLDSELRRLLAARKARLNTIIHGNRIEIQVLRGGTSRTAKLIGFVHNPQPDPGLLFDTTRSCRRTCHRVARHIGLYFV